MLLKYFFIKLLFPKTLSIYVPLNWQLPAKQLGNLALKNLIKII